jgi:hypothetical protein
MWGCGDSPHPHIYPSLLFAGSYFSALNNDIPYYQINNRQGFHRFRYDWEIGDVHLHPKGEFQNLITLGRIIFSSSYTLDVFHPCSNSDPIKRQHLRAFKGSVLIRAMLATGVPTSHCCGDRKKVI